MTRNEALAEINRISEKVDDKTLKCILNGVSVLCLVNADMILLRCIDEAVTLSLQKKL